MQANAFPLPSLSDGPASLNDSDAESTAAAGVQSDAAELESGEEMELAAELLGVQSEEQLDRFLGSLLSRTLPGATRFARSPGGQQVLGLLKSTALQALPQFFSKQGGRQSMYVGRRGAVDSGSLFDLELEGLSHEDGEFEVARRFARLAHRSLRPLDPHRATPMDARRFFRRAARAHAPGLYAHSVWVPEPVADAAPPVTGFPFSGRWVRHGNTITLR